MSPVKQGVRADPGKSYGFVYTSLSTILEPGWSGYLAEKSYCRSVLALVTRMVEIGEATVTLCLKLLLRKPLLVATAKVETCGRSHPTT